MLLTTICFLTLLRKALLRVPPALVPLPDADYAAEDAAFDIIILVDDLISYIINVH